MSGVYKPGAWIGTENGLAKTFGVSRITVRQALSLLEKDGLIVRLRARGTFVADNVQPRAVVELNGYLDDILLHGYAAETVVHDYREERATADVAARLKLSDGDLVWRLRRTRAEGDQPKAWLINYLPPDIGARYTAGDLERNSLLQLLDSAPDTHLAWGREKITADGADQEVAQGLGIEPGAPILLVERIVYTDADRPVELV
ncbi:MAG: GntR family transcriptional regulator, partial [Nocardiopsaceae bacterium]|nr:GntR family transcriptional regulator [Nocardiopsaceae bacterium]